MFNLASPNNQSSSSSAAAPQPLLQLARPTAYALPAPQFSFFPANTASLQGGGGEKNATKDPTTDVEDQSGVSMVNTVTTGSKPSYAFYSESAPAPAPSATPKFELGNLSLNANVNLIGPKDNKFAFFENSYNRYSSTTVSFCLACMS
ncbi:unnamed protein product [Amoebophrya sp. A120]|nr:unnamed protein product [Amoebophrya sp. A120]|eukprot:GSA120T00013259001.1